MVLWFWAAQAEVAEQHLSVSRTEPLEVEEVEQTTHQRYQAKVRPSEWPLPYHPRQPVLQRWEQRTLAQELQLQRPKRYAPSRDLPQARLPLALRQVPHSRGSRRSDSEQVFLALPEETVVGTQGAKKQTFLMLSGLPGLQPQMMSEDLA